MVNKLSVTTTPEETEQIVHRFMDEVVNKGNYNVIDELVAEDLRDHTPFGKTRGSDAMRETTLLIHTAFPDFSVTPHEVVTDGDTAAVRMTQRGTHEGEFMGFEPTGRTFETEAMAFVHVADGQITERWVQPDMLGLMQQLGVVDPLGE
jgi:steroid delta-isomerase-like uncharacterized protein